MPFPNPKIMQSKNTNALLCGTKCTNIALNIVTMTDIPILVNFVNLLIREMKNINNAPNVEAKEIKNIAKNNLIVFFLKFVQQYLLLPLFLILTQSFLISHQTKI